MSTPHTGAAALQSLISQIHEVSNATCDPDAEGDTRDYRRLAMMVQASVAENLQHQDAAHREGYLRALTDLLATAADGCLPCFDDWDPLACSAAAFAAPAAGAH